MSATHLHTHAQNQKHTKEGLASYRMCTRALISSCVCVCVHTCGCLSRLPLCSLRPYVPIIWPSEHTTQTHLLPFSARTHERVHAHTHTPALPPSKRKVHTHAPAPRDLWPPPQRTITVLADTIVNTHTHTKPTQHEQDTRANLQGEHVRRPTTCLLSERRGLLSKHDNPTSWKTHRPAWNIPLLMDKGTAYCREKYLLFYCTLKIKCLSFIRTPRGSKHTSACHNWGCSSHFAPSTKKDVTEGHIYCFILS